MAAKVAFVARRLGDAGGGAWQTEGREQDVNAPPSRGFSQDELYHEVVRPFVERCVLTGLSASIVTYGGWGSGKSYTLGSLEPQQLTLSPNAANANAGVILRCLQQLYEQLGHGAAIEITCVEVQGEDVMDLLDPKVGAAMGRVPGAATGQVASPGATRSPIAIAAAKRKPVTLEVARSLAEALSITKRAVAYRQAFVTSTRHSSSRTHLVLQLRWRVSNDGTLTGSNVGPGTLTTAGSMSRRPYSAPPRATPGLLPTINSGVVSLNGIGAGTGPVCTLTLVDTCSSCPLLPAKEASAVKKGLLALGRVLGAMQRREALMLRESKLTRLLEGSLDQALLLACLNGADDAGTIQLLRLLQHGASRDGANRRVRRVSSSDSARMSAAWDPAGTPSIRSSVSLRSSINGGPAMYGPGFTCTPSKQTAMARASTMQTVRQAPPNGEAGLPSMSTRTSSSFAGASPAHASGSRIGLGGGLVAAVGSSTGAAASGRIRVRPMPLEVLVAGGAGSEQAVGGEEDDSFPVPPPGIPVVGGGLSGTATTASPGGDSMGSPGPAVGSPVLSPLSALPSTSPGASVAVASPGSTPAYGRSRSISNSGIPTGPASAANTARLRGSVSMMYRGSMAASLVADSPGGAGAGGAVGMVSPTVCGTRQRLASVTARAAPPDVRRSKGFSVLAGKWGPPPSPPSSAGKQEPGFPVLPMVVGAASASPGTAAPTGRMAAYTRSPSGIPSAHGPAAVALSPRTTAAATPEAIKSPVISPASAAPAVPPAPAALSAAATVPLALPAAASAADAPNVTQPATTGLPAEVLAAAVEAEHLDSADEELMQAHALAAAEAVASPSASPAGVAAASSALPLAVFAQASAPGAAANADAQPAVLEQPAADTITPIKSSAIAAAIVVMPASATAGEEPQPAIVAASAPPSDPSLTATQSPRTPPPASTAPTAQAAAMAEAAAVLTATSPTHITPQRTTLSPTGGGLSAKAALAVVMQSRGTPTVKRRSGIPTPPGMTPTSQPRTSPTGSSAAAATGPASASAGQTPPNSARGAPAGATAAAVAAPGLAVAAASAPRRRLLSPSIAGISTAAANPSGLTTSASTTPRLASVGSGNSSGKRGRVSIAQVGQPTVRASMRYGSSAQYEVGGSEGGAEMSGAAGAQSVAAGASGAGMDAGAGSGQGHRQQHPSLSPGTAPLLDANLGGRGGGSRSSNGMRSPSPMLRERRAFWLALTRRSRSALPRPIAEMEGMEGVDDDVGGMEGMGPRTAAASLRARGRSGAGHGGVTLSTQYRSLMSDFQQFRVVTANRAPRRQMSANGRDPGGAEVDAQPANQAEGGAEAAAAAALGLGLGLEGAAHIKRRFGSSKQLAAPDESLMVVAEAVKNSGFSSEAAGAIGPRSPVVAGTPTARAVATPRSTERSLSLAAAAAAAAAAASGTPDDSVLPSPSRQSGTPAALSPCRPPRYPGATPSPSAASAAGASTAAVRVSAFGGSVQPLTSGSRPRLTLIPPESPSAAAADLNLLATAAAVPSPSPRSMTPSNRRISIHALAGSTVVAVGGTPPSAGAHAGSSTAAATSSDSLRALPSPAASPYLAAVRGQTPKRPSLLGMPSGKTGAPSVRVAAGDVSDSVGGHAATHDVGSSPATPAAVAALLPGEDGDLGSSAANGWQVGSAGDDSGDDMFGPQLTPGGPVRSILGPGNLADLNAMLRISRARGTPGSTPNGGQPRAVSLAVTPMPAAAASATDRPARDPGSGGSDGGTPRGRRPPMTSTSSPGDLPSPGAAATADSTPPRAFRRALSRAGAEADGVMYAPALLVAAGDARGQAADEVAAAVQGAAGEVTTGEPTSAVTDSGSFASATGIAAAAAAITPAPGLLRGDGGSGAATDSLILSPTGSGAAAHGALDIVAVGSPVLLSSPPTLAPPLNASGSVSLGSSQRPEQPPSAASRRAAEGIIAGPNATDFNPQSAGHAQSRAQASPRGLGGAMHFGPVPSAGTGAPSISLTHESLLGIACAHQAHDLSVGESVLCGSCNLTPGDLAAVNLHGGRVASHATAAHTDSVQAWPGAASAPATGAGPATDSAAPGVLETRAGAVPSAAPSASTVLAHFTHVPPNHSDLDENSTVLVLESDSELDTAEPVEPDHSTHGGAPPATGAADRVDVAAVPPPLGFPSAPHVGAAAAVHGDGDVGHRPLLPPTLSPEPCTPGQSQQGTPQKGQQQQQQQQQGTPSPRQTPRSVRERIAALEAAQAHSPTAISGAVSRSHITHPRGSTTLSPVLSASHSSNAFPTPALAPRTALMAAASASGVVDVPGPMPSVAERLQALRSSFGNRDSQERQLQTLGSHGAHREGSGTWLPSATSAAATSTPHSARESAAHHMARDADGAGPAPGTVAQVAAALTTGSMSNADSPQTTTSADVTHGAAPMAAAHHQSPQPAGLQQLLGPVPPAPPRQLSAGGATSWGSGRGSSTPNSPMGGLHLQPLPAVGSPSVAELTVRPSWGPPVGGPSPAPVHTAAVQQLGSSSRTADASNAGASGLSLGGVGSPLKSPKDGGASPVLNRRGRSSNGGEGGEVEIIPPPAYPPGFVHWATRLFSGGGAPE